MTPAIRRHTIATAYSVCGGLTRKAARNFYLAFLLLPTEMRRSIYAAYVEYYSAAEARTTRRHRDR